MKRFFEKRWSIALFRSIAPWIARLAAPCPEIARLASESCERKLGWSERWRMRVHYLICDWCRRYAAQVGIIHRAAPQLSSRAPQLLRRTMSDATKERLKKRLQSGGRT